MVLRFYTGNIRKLGHREVFVFGSNLEHKHGAGAAKEAVQRFGAKWGKGGLQGQSYALPTKNTPYRKMPLENIAGHVEQFIYFAKCNPDLTFYVTDIGCGLAGYKPAFIAPLFKDIPENVIVSERFYNIINQKNEEQEP